MIFGNTMVIKPKCILQLISQLFDLQIDSCQGTTILVDFLVPFTNHNIFLKVSVVYIDYRETYCLLLRIMKDEFVQIR